MNSKYFFQILNNFCIIDTGSVSIVFKKDHNSSTKIELNAIRNKIVPKLAI